MMITFLLVVVAKQMEMKSIMVEEKNEGKMAFKPGLDK